MPNGKIGVAGLALLVACASPPTPGLSLAHTARIRESVAALEESPLANPRPNDWAPHGRTRDEQRFSPLRDIDTVTVRRLGIAWTFDLGGYDKVEATPIVVGG